MSIFKKWDERFEDSSLWQFIKFNLVGYSISFVQLILANLLPLLFDRFTAPLPPFLAPLFDPELLFEKGSIYVVDGVVTWGYVLPFFLSNFIGNIYGYFVNMKVTFKGKGSRRSMLIYLAVLFILIVVSTWLQGIVMAYLNGGRLAFLARTIAAQVAGLFQFVVLFPLEKYVLFKEG